VSRAKQSMSAQLVGRALRLLEQRGLEPLSSLAHAAIDPAVLTNPSARIGYGAVDALIEHIATRVPRAELGLALAQVEDDRSYGALGLLLLASSSYRQGLALSFGYQRLWGDGERFTLSRQGTACRVRFRHPGYSELARAVLSECALAEVLLGARRLVAPAAVALSLELSHAPLGDVAPLSEYFGVAPRFGAAECAITLAGDVVDRPLSMLRDVLARSFEEQCRRALGALPERTALLERARSAVRERLDRAPSLSDVAARLRMSARTLQRSLAREGTSFQQLVDDERRARAEQLLEQGAALKEAALRVGYSDPSALARARKRWTR
jgi:AraC-like DNA-binding protein